MRYLTCALALLASAAVASAQTWQPARSGAAAGAGFDPWVQPSAVYQPAGRAYGINDPFSVAQPSAATVQPSTVYTQPGSVYVQPGTGYAQGGTTFVQPGATLAQPGVMAPQSTWVGPSAASPSDFGAAPAIDPYTCQPMYQQPFGVVTPVAGPTGIYRQPFAEFEGRIGDPPDLLQGNLFVPFLQRADSFWFADIRGHWDENKAAEGNWGIAYRRLFGDKIVGVYGFYDLRHTQYNNNFHGATIGAEVLELEWEGRLNWYIPEGGGKTANALNTASLVGDAIVVQQGVERAMWGLDGEVGRLLWRGGVYDAELRGFLGGFYFDNSSAAFRSYGGPRARLEGRVYDLPQLGVGSRITLGGTIQWDEISDFQGIASLNLRIPFGPGAAPVSGKLSPIERRMLSPIRRDEDIVTQGGLRAAEATEIVSTGVAAVNITEINSDTADVPGDVADGSNVVVVTSDISVSDTIELNADQFIGGQFEVEGVDSGARAVFGEKYTITGTDASDNVIQIADGSTVTGLAITGGQHGIYGGGDDDNDFADGDPGVSGFLISNTSITSPGDDGIRLDGTVNGDITGNELAAGANFSGLRIQTLQSGQIANNTVTDSGAGQEGIEIETMESGWITNNTVTGWGGSGVRIDTLNGGTIANNTSTDNDLDGFLFVDFNGGVVSGNTATDNTTSGFAVSSFDGGTMSGNTASGSAVGFSFGANTGGTIVSNQAMMNVDGFSFFNINETVPDSVLIDSNTASNNTDDGFESVAFTDGTFSNNVATGNTDAGYEFPALPAAAVSTDNTGSGNGSDDTLPDNP